MRKQTILFLILSAVMMSFTVDRVIRKQNDGTVVINTKTLARDVRGYNGPTPVEIHIKNNRIVKIITLTNSETGKYLNMVNKTLVPKWIGMKVDNALSSEPDGVTGATFTSKAVKENVRRGLKYYKKGDGRR